MKDMLNSTMDYLVIGDMKLKHRLSKMHDGFNHFNASPPPSMTEEEYLEYTEKLKYCDWFSHPTVRPFKPRG